MRSRVQGGGVGGCGCGAHGSVMMDVMGAMVLATSSNVMECASSQCATSTALPGERRRMLASRSVSKARAETKSYGQPSSRRHTIGLRRRAAQYSSSSETGLVKTLDVCSSSSAGAQAMPLSSRSVSMLLSTAMRSGRRFSASAFAKPQETRPSLS
jgi:hypothetical protein